MPSESSIALLATAQKEPGGPRIFLSHNRLDRSIIRDIGQALEIEFGISHFLDENDIPAGVEFLSFIEQEIAASSGCAIFLGASGWGPTHIWEAERALERYRSDGRFKLIPVVLPGATQSDMNRLGDGAVFHNINWVDFKGSDDFRRNVRLLYAALTGNESIDWALSGVTPYLVRRDARNWVDGGRQDKSLLYQGAKLKHAEDLLRSAPALTGSAETIAFISASVERVQDRTRRIWTAAVSAIVLLTLLASFAWVQRNLALDRELLAVSRLLATEADAAAGADRQLLLAVRALKTAPTADARRRIVALLQRWSRLDGMHHVEGHEISAVLPVLSKGRIILGTDAGTIIAKNLHHDPQSKRSTNISVLAKTGGNGSITVIAPGPANSVIAGSLSGAVHLIRQGSTEVVRNATPTERLGDGIRDRQVHALAMSPDGSQLAIGDARKGLLDIRSLRQTRSIEISLQSSSAVTALAWLDGKTIIVGTTDEFLELVDVEKQKSVDKMPAGFPKEGNKVSLIAIENGGGLQGKKVTVARSNGTLAHFRTSGKTLEPDGNTPVNAPPFLTALNLISDNRQIFFGAHDGTIASVTLDGLPSEVDEPAHRTLVVGFAHDRERKTTLSVARDGSIAIWQFDRKQSHGLRKFAHFPGSIDAMMIDHRGQLLVATRRERTSHPGENPGIWRHGSNGWRRVLDLLTVSRQLLSKEQIEPTLTPDADGFVSISNGPISEVVLSQRGNVALWVTTGGAIVSAVIGTNRARLHGRVHGGLLSFAINARGNTAATLDHDGNIQILRGLTTNDPQTKRLAPLRGTPRSVAIGASSNRLAVGFEDGRIEIRALRFPDRLLASTDLPTKDIVAHMATAPSNRLVVAAGRSRDAGVALFSAPFSDVTALVPMPAPGQFQPPGNRMRFSPDGKTLAVRDTNGALHLWDMTDNRHIGLIAASVEPTSPMAFRDNASIVTAGMTESNLKSFDFSISRLIERAEALAGRHLRRSDWKGLLEQPLP